MQGELGLLGTEQVRRKARPQERAALPTKLNSPNIEAGRAPRFAGRTKHTTAHRSPVCHVQMGSHFFRNDWTLFTLIFQIIPVCLAHETPGG